MAVIYSPEVNAFASSGLDTLEMTSEWLFIDYQFDDIISDFNEINAILQI